MDDQVRVIYSGKLDHKERLICSLILAAHNRHTRKIKFSKNFFLKYSTVHGRSDIDTFNMILQFKREEENLCGHRGLLPSSDQQTYIILTPRNLRVFYEKLISPIQNKSNHYHQQFNNHSMKFEQNFEKTMLTYHNINRFFAAFIDHVSNDH
jgi:meckelin